MASGQGANAPTGSDLELMRQEVFRISAKIDAFPQIYVTRIDHDPWRVTIEKRIDSVEEDNRRLYEMKSQDHTHLAEQMIETERRILEKLDEKDTQRSQELKAVAKDGQQFRSLVLLNLIAWLVIPAIFLIVQYVLSHPK